MVDRAERSGAATVTIRRARLDDLPALMAIFAADTLGGHGDSADPVALPDYEAAFRRIEDSPNVALFVAELDGAVVGTFQTTLIVSLTGRGAANLAVEAVQTRNDMRGKGIGAAMMHFAIDEARGLGARQVQLMSNATRGDAHRFYERLGFAKSHAGFKMKLR